MSGGSKRHTAADRERDSRLFKLIRRWVGGHRGLRSKHGANLALDILAANGIEEIAIQRPDGRLVHLATADKVIASGVIRTGAFSREIVDAFARLLGEHGIAPAEVAFVNVGANIGTACLNAYDAGFRNLVAIEPEPRNFRLLQLNLAQLPGADVRLVEAAIGEAAGVLPLHRHARNLGAHSLVASPGHGDEGGTNDRIEVRVEPLAAIVDAATPFVLFVDVEGFEPQVLRGAGDLLARFCRAIALEVTPHKYAPADAADLARRIAAFGETIVSLPDGDVRPSTALPDLMAQQAGRHFDIAVVRPPSTRL